MSDRNAKRDFKPVHPQDVLKRLAQVPVSTWTLKSDEHHTPHMGSMAQDFHAAFKLGNGDRGIDTADIIGVSVAAIQGAATT